ncbi:BrnT family toxin [Algicola sagamiensis]|uniref:BrnT family toxin n=1 Tax=Algicola sagamiensis TaxID=163869 RepID=UPI0003A477F8|nr:BrnT family toxin [Algicola sagamiensis]
MKFEWDDNKNVININKHGIDFRAAAKIFNDPHFIVNEDSRTDYGEPRYQIIGAVDPHGVLFVVYTERYDDTIRLISARKANKKEQQIYKQLRW